MEKIDRLLLLVGSNPLPNFLSARILAEKTSINKIVLFHTKETEAVKDQLKEQLEESLKNIPVEWKCIDKATHGKAVRQVFEGISASDHLNYTGGTKVMAAHARLAFKGDDSQASYLDEREGVLRLDNSYEISLAECSFELKLSEILKLHGIEYKNRTAYTPQPTEEDLSKIVDRVFREPQSAEELYKCFREGEKFIKYKDAKKNPVSLEWGLSVSRVPESTWNERTYDGWRTFLTGGWLEQWCAKQLKEILGQTVEISVSLNCERKGMGRQFEIDVAFVRNYRLYVISCTTAQNKDMSLCKSKLFEVAKRAQQLGGDLARSALVCLLHGSNENGSRVDQVQNDIKDIWDAPNTPKVFGLNNLKTWAGIDSDPDTLSLKKWVES